MVHIKPRQHLTEHASKPEAKSEKHKSPAEQVAKVAHKAHLAAEGLEGVAGTRELAEKLRHAEALRSAHSKAGRELQALRGGIVKLENAAKNGGGPKVTERLKEAKAAYAQGKAAFDAEKPLVHAAENLLLEHKSAAKFSKTAAAVRLGKAALHLEKAMEGSAAGRAILKGGHALTNPAVVKGLVAVGMAAEGVISYQGSPTKTVGGKAANATLGAAGAGLVMAHPVVAVADALVLPKGYKLSEIVRGGAAAFAAAGEAAVTGDTGGMDKFTEKSKQGKFGVIMQEASKAGEWWAENGFIGGMKKVFR